MKELKYALNGNNLPKNKISVADEIILNIPPGLSLENFIKKYKIEEIVNEYKDKTILLIGIKVSDCETLVTMSDYKNVLYGTKTIKELKKILDSGFYSKKLFTMEEVIDLDTFFNLVKDYNIKRIAVGGKLGFTLGAIGKDNNEIVIMVNPCNWNSISIDSFFIRPDDIDYYSDFIDVLYFPSTEIRNREFSYYNIYKKKEPWYGELKELLPKLESDFNNKYFIGKKTKNDVELVNKSFRNIRSVCEHRCEEKECSLCFLMERLSNVIKDKEQLIINSKLRKD